MRNKNKQQYSSMPKLVMTITIIMMVGTLLGAVGYLIIKIPCGCVTGNKEFKKIAKDDINNWKVYSDEKYNFQVKYPTDISDPAISEKENAGKKEIQKEINFNINDDLEISIFVWNMEASEGNDLAEAKEKYDEVSIGGNYGWQSKQNYKTADENEEVSDIYFFETYVYSKTHIYQIEYKGIYDKEDFDLYQKMVSTFEIKEDETANWQTYRNEEYGFEVRHPKNITIKEQDFSMPNSIGFIINFGKISNNLPVRISVSNEEMIGVIKEAMVITDKKEVIVDGVKGAQIIGQGQKDGSAIESIILLTKNQKLYQITGSGNVFNQILSTFKFTEKN